MSVRAAERPGHRFTTRHAQAIYPFINAGGLGRLIFDGIQQAFPAKIITGGVLASLTAIAADVGFTRLERRLTVERSD